MLGETVASGGAALPRSETGTNFGQAYLGADGEALTTHWSSPLCWEPESSFASPELYRLHVVEYYAEVNEDAAYLRPIVEILKSGYVDGKYYPLNLIKSSERMVRDYASQVLASA
jgi:hypothetical protein